MAEWQWREVSLTFNIDIVSFRPHHLFAWWWGALSPGYLDLCRKCYQVTTRQGNSLGRGPLTPWPTLVSQTTLVFTCHCSLPPNGFARPASWPSPAPGQIICLLILLTKHEAAHHGEHASWSIMEHHGEQHSYALSSKRPLSMMPGIAVYGKRHS